MRQKGFVGLILLLITVSIMALLYVLTNRLASDSTPDVLKPLTNPQGINQTQDVVNEYLQKSIERQSIEIE